MGLLEGGDDGVDDLGLRGVADLLEEPDAQVPVLSSVPEAEFAEVWGVQAVATTRAAAASRADRTGSFMTCPSEREARALQHVQ